MIKWEIEEKCPLIRPCCVSTTYLQLTDVEGKRPCILLFAIRLFLSAVPSFYSVDQHHHGDGSQHWITYMFLFIPAGVTWKNDHITK